MTGIVEKNYSEALFHAILEDCPEELERAMSELEKIAEIIAETPDFQKFCDAPTVSAAEKFSVLGDAFAKTVSPYIYNFLRLLAEAGRMRNFGGILKNFKLLYNEHFNIAEITVTSVFPLTEKQREEIAAKMAEITGKKIVLTAKTDGSLIGGIVIDYGNRRFDGSVRSRLEALRQSFSQLIG